jgi:uncharacterized protein (DUF1330 family)
MPLKPTRDQIRTIVESPLETPVVMLNLLKYADKAAGEPKLSGEESYQKYGDEVRAHMEKVGAKLLWRGRVDSVVIGDDADAWDEVLLVEYPSRKAFIQMTSTQDYEKTGEHRTKALADSRLLAMTQRFRISGD